MIDDPPAPRPGAEPGDFMQLYKSCVRPVYSYIYSRVRNTQETEDLPAQAFERAWASFASYAPTGSLRAWLFTIAHRTLVDHFRHSRSSPLSVEDPPDDLRDPDPGPEEVTLQSEEVRQVLAIISELDHEQQEILGLRFMGDLSYKEIARAVGKSEAAVKMAAYRALAEVRRRYADER